MDGWSEPCRLAWMLRLMMGAIAMATIGPACGSTAVPPPDPAMAVVPAPLPPPPAASAEPRPAMVMAAAAPATDRPATKQALAERVVGAIVNGSIEQLRELALSEADLDEACPGREKQPGGLPRVGRSVESTWSSCEPILRGRSVHVVEVTGGSERSGDRGCAAVRSLHNMSATLNVDGHPHLMIFDDPIYIKDRFYALFDPVKCSKSRGIVADF